MNVERINHLIDWLQDGAPHKDAQGNRLVFDMEAWQIRTDCGTSCCLAGATVQFFDPKFAEDQLDREEGRDDMILSRTPIEASKLLGLDYVQANELFVPWGEHMSLSEFALTHDVSPRGAIHALTTLKEKGCPEWPRR